MWCIEGEVSVPFWDVMTFKRKYIIGELKIKLREQRKYKNRLKQLTTWIFG